MGKNLRDRKFPIPKNCHAGRCLGYPARLSFPLWRREVGWGRGNLLVLLGSPLDNRLPHHGSSQRKREENKWNMTMAKYEEVTDIDVTDRI